MKHHVHRGAPAAKLQEPSPGQAALLADIHEEIARLSALRMRASRLHHVRTETPEAAAIRFACYALSDMESRLAEALRRGLPLRTRYTMGVGTELFIEEPLAEVIQLEPFLKRTAT